jgi:hypothetical protein
MTAKELHAAAFHPHRNPRSAQYKEGALYILRLRCGEIEKQPHPYKQGTALSDAWYSGCVEGHAIYRSVTDAA